MRAKQLHPIRYVAHLTGLTPHVIRAWERRYSAVVPSRTATNRRLYSEADIERLRLLQIAVKAGHAIGQLARLTNKELFELLEGEQAHSPSMIGTGVEGSSPFSLYEACISAIVSFDTAALESSLTRATIDLSRVSLIDQVIVPLIQKLSNLWSSGAVKILHEHMASSTIRTFLGDLLRFSGVPQRAPRIAVTTPAGQLHELGALIAAVTAASEGWQTIYLGPNLPAEEIVSVAEHIQARVVALSIVYPSDDPGLVGELERMNRYLSDEVTLIVGGRAAEAYHRTLEATAAVRLHDIPSFRHKLESLRSGEPL